MRSTYMIWQRGGEGGGEDLAEPPVSHINDFQCPTLTWWLQPPSALVVCNIILQFCPLFYSPSHICHFLLIPSPFPSTVLLTAELSLRAVTCDTVTAKYS